MRFPLGWRKGRVQQTGALLGATGIYSWLQVSPQSRQRSRWAHSGALSSPWRVPTEQDRGGRVACCGCLARESPSQLCRATICMGLQERPLTCSSSLPGATEDSHLQMPIRDWPLGELKLEAVKTPSSFWEGKGSGTERCCVSSGRNTSGCISWPEAMPDGLNYSLNFAEVPAPWILPFPNLVFPPFLDAAPNSSRKFLFYLS